MNPDIEQAIQLRRSTLGPVCLFIGLTGLTTMLLLAGWTSAEGWIPGIGGRPDSLELTVLGAVVLTSASFALARLWPGRPTGGLPGG